MDPYIPDNKIPHVGIIFGTTGGRHPQMLGLAKAIEGYLQPLQPQYTRLGYSGGAIVVAIQARQVDHQEWLKKAGQSSISEHGKIGGWFRFWRNLYWLFKDGGLLNSEYLYEKVFSKIIPGKIIEPSAYCGAWCVSSHNEIHFLLEEETMARSVLSSCALQFAISPVKWTTLPKKYHMACGVEEEENPISFFVDGGTSSALGVNNIKYIPEVMESEKIWKKKVPVIGVSIDPIYSKHDPDFDDRRWYSKIMEGIWSMIKANIHQDISDAKEDRPVYLCVAPTPKDLAYTSSKFNINHTEIKKLYDTGYKQGLEWVKTKQFGKNKNQDLLEALTEYYHS